ncbi:hypothetical protein M079_0400 [Bacteroides fragilis str. 3996 N(B) 6]|nr:hypothetical protein M078_0503 [Bacteroides fragilis str. 2-F-2 \
MPTCSGATRGRDCATACRLQSNIEKVVSKNLTPFPSLVEGGEKLILFSMLNGIVG